MSSTIEALARFAMLQFRTGPAGGAQILRRSTLRKMQAELENAAFLQCHIRNPAALVSRLGQHRS